MKLANVGLVSTMALLGVVAIGCAAKAEGEEESSLGTNESLLVADNEEAEQVEEDSEAGLDEPLSGAEQADPGSPADATDEAAFMEKVKTNPGRWFKPAGCITTTIAGNVATHVFKDCTGPYGLASFNGTVTSTYVRGSGSLTITHEASGFAINGATVSGKRVVVYSKSGTVITKKRTGSWSGTTKRGKAFSHDADFTVTWDPAAKCVTRDGSASTTVGAREFSRTIDGYKRCGIGNLGCPESGKIVLSRTKGDQTASVTIEFLGGRQYTVTGSGGRTAKGVLVCRASS